MSLAAALLLSALAARPGPCEQAARRLAAASHDAPKLSLAEARAAGLRGLDDFAGLPFQEGAEHVRLPWLPAVRERVSAAAAPEDLDRELMRAALRAVETCKALGQEEGRAPAIDRALLAEILGRPEYDLKAQDENFVTRLFERIRTWFRDVFATSAAVREATTSIRALFLAAVCAAVLALGYKLARARVARARPGAKVQAPIPTVLESPDRHRADARRALEARDWREATRSALLVLLSQLERSRLASPGRADTNREVARHIADRGGPEELAREAEALVDWYDRVWYGVAPVGEAEARRFFAQVEALSARAAGVGEVAR